MHTDPMTWLATGSNVSSYNMPRLRFQLTNHWIRFWEKKNIGKVLYKKWDSFFFWKRKKKKEIFEPILSPLSDPILSPLLPV